MQKNNYYLAKKISDALQNKSYKDNTANIWIIEKELNKESRLAENLVRQPSEPTCDTCKYQDVCDQQVELHDDDTIIEMKELRYCSEHESQ